MSDTGKFRVLRAFLIDGKRIEVGKAIALDDPELISHLIDAGKVEAADDKTAARIGRWEPKQWTEPPRQHAVSPFGDRGVVSIRQDW